MSSADGDNAQSGVRDPLRWSLQALACEADVQLSLFPDFVCKVDELALDFDHWYQTARELLGDEITGDRLATLQAMDDRLDVMSGEGSEFVENLWFEDALSHRPQWTEVRALASTALACFGWPAEPPPRGRSFYAGG